MQDWMSQYIQEWIRLAEKNGVSERNREDVERYILDMDEFENYIQRRNLHLYYNDTHYILCTSPVEAYC